MDLIVPGSLHSFCNTRRRARPLKGKAFRKWLTSKINGFRGVSRSFDSDAQWIAPTIAGGKNYQDKLTMATRARP
jgi:hypothetical protein